MDRDRIFARDDYRCVYCGRCGRTDSDVELTVDHVEPRMRGGDNSPGNLVTACLDCNRRKAGLAAWAFLEDRAQERAMFLARATHVWPRLRAAVVEAAEKAERRKG